MIPNEALSVGTFNTRRLLYGDGSLHDGFRVLTHILGVWSVSSSASRRSRLENFLRFQLTSLSTMMAPGDVRAQAAFLVEETDFGQSIFGHRGFGPANFGQSNFGQSLANPFLDLVCVMAPNFGAQTPEGWGPEKWGSESGGPKFRAFFFRLPPHFCSFGLSLWGSSRGFLVVFGSAGAVKCSPRAQT